MRISDLSSDVCSSDLEIGPAAADAGRIAIPIVIPLCLPVLLDDGKIVVPECRTGLVRGDVQRGRGNDAAQIVSVLKILDGHRPIGDQLRIVRSEEHTSELQSLMRSSYAVFCLKKKKTNRSKQNLLITR